MNQEEGSSGLALGSCGESGSAGRMEQSMGLARDSGSRAMKVDGGSSIGHLSLGARTCQQHFLRHEVPCQIILVLLKAKEKRSVPNIQTEWLQEYVSICVSENWS